VRSVFVKICGITNEEDALLAVAMGADALGFVFAPSSRQVAAGHVRDIVRRLPPEILTLGVFRDESPQRVVEQAQAAGLAGVQLHGHETPEDARWVRSRVSFLIQAFPAGAEALRRSDEWGADVILIDSPTPGSGQIFDWSLAEGAPSGRRIVLAGGLDPDNVADAIARVRPWGVDVSSGVEASPGRKDARKVRAFVAAAKAAGGEDEEPVRERAPYDWQEEGG
jgi:phosphoribosylanthranilate isomerase